MGEVVGKGRIKGELKNKNDLNSFFKIFCHLKDVQGSLSSVVVPFTTDIQKVDKPRLKGQTNPYHPPF